MVSETVSKALKKAAERAARIAHADAGLGEAEAPKHPGKKKDEALEKAKEQSRQGLTHTHTSTPPRGTHIAGLPKPIQPLMKA